MLSDSVSRYSSDSENCWLLLLKWNNLHQTQRFRFSFEKISTWPTQQQGCGHSILLNLDHGGLGCKNFNQIKVWIIAVIVHCYFYCALAEKSKFGSSLLLCIAVIVCVIGCKILIKSKFGSLRPCCCYCALKVTPGDLWPLIRVMRRHDLGSETRFIKDQNKVLMIHTISQIISTASGALVVGGVRDIYM